MKHSLSKMLELAFQKRTEHIGFGLRGKQFLFVASYEEFPLIEGMLFTPSKKKEDLWNVIRDDGSECEGDKNNPPEPWKSLPMFLAEKVEAVASLSCNPIE